MKHFFTVCIFLCTISLLGKSPSLKADHLVITDINEETVTWMVDMKQAHYTMVIVGPDGVEKRHYSEGEDAIFEITNNFGELRRDGLYKFEITFSPILSDDQKEIMQQLRDNPSDSTELRKMANLPVKYENVSGNFRISNGAIVVPENLREMEMQQALMEAAKGEEGFSNGRDGEDKPGEGWDTDEGGTEDLGESDFDDDSRAQTIATDLIVQGSECVGFDCVSGESFGFDTLRLKENNLRIKFQDTSAGSFPSNDWQITANESSNGGANKLSIDDIDGGRTPFTIEAGAPSHSLYVDDGGRIGIGKSTPSVEVHVVDGDSPTLRLEQNGSSGFQPQTWDIAGNETNFFVRDVTNASKLPFKIRPGASTNSLVLDVDGDVGVGLLSPQAPLHIQTNTGNAGEVFRVTNNGGSYFSMENSTTSGTWFFTHENNSPNRFLISYGANPVAMAVTQTGDVTISGELFTAGSTCGGGCDKVFSADYHIESIDEHAAKMWQNSYLPAVGPTPENTPINLSRKTGGMLHELEKAHIYIEQLHHRALEKEQTITDLQSRLEALEVRLSKLEK